jgi:hypothetical protein
VRLISLICHTRIVIGGHPCGFVAFFDNLTIQNIGKNRCWHVQMMLLEQMLAQWWHPVASSEALDLLHRAMRAALYFSIALVIKTASFVRVFVDCCLFACCPGRCWGNTEGVVAQCRHPVASRVALNMPHLAMPSVLLRRTVVVIKTASG